MIRSLFGSKDRQAEAKITLLKTALHFYANPEHYKQKGWQGDPEPSDIDKDRGSIASMALELTQSG